MSSEKVVVLHVGTHKTGTKTIQKFLTENYMHLGSLGIHMAQTGRVPISDTLATPGQHQIAWDFIQTDGTEHLDKLLVEMVAAAAPIVLVSSEDFHPLHVRRDALQKIADAFASIGYRVKIVVYLRQQGRYAESVYVQYVKGNYLLDFAGYLERVLEEGAYLPLGTIYPMEYRYTHLLAPFRDVFGAENLIVRPYLPDRDVEYLLRDFLTVIGIIRGGLTVGGLRNVSPVENASLSFMALLDRIYAIAVRADAAAAPGPAQLVREHFPHVPDSLLHGRFFLLTYAEMMRFLERFKDDNLQVAREYGITVPLVTEADVPPETTQFWHDAQIQREIIAFAIDRWRVPLQPLG